jgi:hypothetical protein
LLAGKLEEIGPVVHTEKFHLYVSSTEIVIDLGVLLEASGNYPSQLVGRMPELGGRHFDGPFQCPNPCRSVGAAVQPWLDAGLGMLQEVLVLDDLAQDRSDLLAGA